MMEELEKKVHNIILYRLFHDLASSERASEGGKDGELGTQEKGLKSSTIMVVMRVA